METKLSWSKKRELKIAVPSLDAEQDHLMLRVWTLSDGTTGVVIISCHLYAPGSSALVKVLLNMDTPPNKTAKVQEVPAAIEYRSYQKVKVYGRVVSNEFRVWNMLTVLKGLLLMP